MNGSEQIAREKDAGIVPPVVRKYATGWRRVGAAFLDSAALAPLDWFSQAIWNYTERSIVLLPWSIFESFAGLAYVIGFVTLYGQTPGKMACGVKILDVHEGKVSFRQALLREIVPLLVAPYFLYIQVGNILDGHLANRASGDLLSYWTFMWIALGWLGLEILTMLTNDKRRAVHDFIAGTVVVRTSANRSVMVALLVLLALHWLVGVAFTDPNLVADR